MHTNPYAVLGVPNNTNVDACKAAWKKLVRKHHPDQHPEHERSHHQEKLRQINDAWDRIQKGDVHERPQRNKQPTWTQRQGWASQAAQDLYQELLRRAKQQQAENNMHNNRVITKFTLFQNPHAINTLKDHFDNVFERQWKTSWRQAKLHLWKLVFKSLFSFSFKPLKDRQTPPVVVFPACAKIDAQGVLRLVYQHSHLSNPPDKRTPVFFFVPSLVSEKNFLGQHKNWTLVLGKGHFVKHTHPVDVDILNLRVPHPQGTQILELHKHTPYGQQPSTVLRLQFKKNWKHKIVFRKPERTQT